MSGTEREVNRDFRVKIENIFQEFTGANLLEIHFADLIVPDTPEAEAQKRQEVVSELINTFRTFQNERPEVLFSYVLNWRLRSDVVDALIVELTEALLQNQILIHRQVCEALLTSPDLKITNEKLWKYTLEYVDKSILKLDYKGVRDVLKLLFDHISNCPPKFPTELRPSHLLIENIILKICDRSCNLLPAYFIINEIRKLYYEPRCFPHWRVAACFTDVVESFRQLAQIVTATGRPYMLPVPSHFGLHLNTSWKLEPATLKFYMKGTLPFPTDVIQAQNYIIHQVILQPSFRDMLGALLYLQPYKQAVRCSLEEIFVSTILELMAEVEREGRLHRQVWSMLGTVLIFLVVNALVNFSKLIKNLQSKLLVLPYRKARDDLMWFLMQCLSAIVSKSTTIEDMHFVLELYRTLYTGSEEFSVSESDPSCVFMMAATCIWVLILERVKEASNDPNFSRLQLKNIDVDIPPSINTQITFLKKSKTKVQLSLDNCFMFATFCNAYSTTKETFHTELAPMINDFLEGGRTSNVATVPNYALPGGLLADGKLAPLKIEFLDSVTAHVRLTIMHSLLDILMKFIQQKTPLHLSPALVETYARLLSYLDIENIGLNKFVTRLITEAYKVGGAERQQQIQTQQQQQQQGQAGSQFPIASSTASQVPSSKTGAAEIMHVACEIISYRLFQVPTNYRTQIFHALYQTAPLFNHNVQFFWTVESAKARQITWIPLQDIIQPTFLKILNQPSKDGTKSLFYDNEELCKLMILTIAKAYVVSGGEGLPDDNYRSLVHQLPQHHFPNGTLQFFPYQLISVYNSLNSATQQAATSLVNRQHVRHAVDQDYVKTWRSTGNDAALIDYFCRRQSSKTFLCIVWRHLYENGELSMIAYRILNELGPKVVLQQLATLIDYILVDITSLNLPQCIDALSKMVWKYAVVPLDWLVFTALMRPYDGTDGFYAILIAFLLLQNEEFLNRAQECCSTMSPEFWRQGPEMFEKHAAYYQKYPEKLWSNVIYEQFRGGIPSTVMPVYFGNVCFVILPVVDLLLQRIIELPDAHDKIFKKLLDSVGQLYKFHPQPITFLYTTLRFYEKCLTDKADMKQKLVYAVYASLVPVRGENWLLSSEFLKFIQSPPAAANSPNGSLVPDMDYFAHTVKRLVDCFAPSWDTSARPSIDWRFCEFAGPQPYVLHAVCVELMSLSCSPVDVGSRLIDTLVKCYPLMSRKEVNRWLNALGLIFATLPIVYSEPLYDRIVEVLLNGELEYWSNKGSIFAKLNFERQFLLTEDILACRLMALGHAIWLQVTIGYLNVLPQRLREKFKPVVQTEAQFIYVLHLVAPFLQRLHQERSRFAMDVATDFYEMLLAVDKHLAGKDFKHEDAICDLLYHMKYMYVGDGIRNDTDRIIPQLKNASLQNKLRFISHQQVESGGAAGSVPA